MKIFGINRGSLLSVTGETSAATAPSMQNFHEDQHEPQFPG